MTKVVQDLRYAARTLRKSPVFTAVAFLTLALGIGANSAIFSLIDALLLRPLPFPQPDRLMLVWEDTSMFGLKDSPVALGNYTDWRAQNHVFQQMGATEQSSFRLTGGGEPIQVQGGLVTGSLFATLGVRPALGRLFREDEDQPGAARVAILSDGLWRRRFGGDPGMVGRTANINEEKYEIVGVMPPGFRFPDADNDLWAPAGTVHGPGDFANRGRHNWMVAARLLPGMGRERANEEIHAIALRNARDYPRTNAGVGAFVAPLREHFVGETRPVLTVLAGAVAFVLLIACANIANLLLARASNRRREVAIRTAIGAGRGQIVRQLLTENLLLAVAGGVGGLALATWSLGFLERLVPRGMAAMTGLAVDGRVLGFTLLVSLVTGALFGLAPALQNCRVNIHEVLKQGGARHGTARGARGVRRALVVSEVALAFVLLVGAALMIQTFSHLRGIDPGFRTKNILTLKTPLSAGKYGDAAKRAAYYDEVARRVTALPGVLSAGFTLGLPLAKKGWVNGFMIEGRAAPAGGQFFNANYRVVTPGYLETMGVPLRAGRYLDPRDNASAPHVALINETMKRKFWPAESPLGKRFQFGSEDPWVTVAGVVGDVRQAGLDAPPKPEMYLAAAQEPNAAPVLALRTAGDPAKLAAAVRREIRAVDQDQPVTELRTMEEVVDTEVFQRRVQMVLLSLFAVLAVLLASLGIYGVLAYLVAQRTQEIGIRMALGARPADVLFTVAGQGMAWSVIGIALGAVGAFAVSRVLSQLLFGVTATDPATFAAVAALLLLVASLASYIPARRAMKVDPILALREE